MGTNSPSSASAHPDDDRDPDRRDDQPNDRLGYRIPADPAVMYPHDSGALNPAPEVLERRSGDSAEDLQGLRDRALAEASGQAAAECALTFELPER